MARRGTSITLREAARKYRLNPATLSRWARKGLVTVIAPSPGKGYPTTLDESSVSAIAELYHQNPGQGKHTTADNR